MRNYPAERKLLIKQLGDELEKPVKAILAERDEWKRRAINAEEQLASIGWRASERMRT